MKTKKMLFYTLAFLMGGCVQSLHPLFTEKDLIFDEKLVGVWAEESNTKRTWEFKKTGKKTYELIHTDSDGEKGQFKAGLGRLDSTMFLDLYPEEPDPRGSDFYKIHLLGVHTFMKIDQIEPTLQMRVMNPKYFSELLDRDPNLIKHEVLKEQDKQIVLTASTKELQKFMLKYGKDPNVFPDPFALTRITDPNSKEEKPQ